MVIHEARGEFHIGLLCLGRQPQAARRTKCTRCCGPRWIPPADDPHVVGADPYARRKARANAEDAARPARLRHDAGEGDADGALVRHGRRLRDRARLFYCATALPSAAHLNSGTRPASHQVCHRHQRDVEMRLIGRRVARPPVQAFLETRRPGAYAALTSTGSVESSHSGGDAGRERGAKRYSRSRRSAGSVCGICCRKRYLLPRAVSCHGPTARLRKGCASFVRASEPRPHVPRPSPPM